MLFTSYEFILFLIVLFLLYYAIPKKFQWQLLLIASYLFYAYAGVHYIVYILGTTLTTYIASININKLQVQQAEYVKSNRETLSREERKAYKESMKKKQRTWMILCLVFNFGVLAVLKYTDFAISNVNSLFATLGVDKELPFFRFALPLGISFYTFQTMGYIIDVYREKYSIEKNLFRLALFVSFFPQLIQGPISRFDDLKKTLFLEHSIDRIKIAYGLERILWGYFKKLVIADRLLVGVTTIVGNPQEYQGVYVLVGMFFYAIDLYCDFTGGIDIVIGLAQVLGIDIGENFIRPYFSKSITEYWRRWHISLGTWFKDYIFYPLSISKSMLRFSKKSRKWLGNGIGKRMPVYVSSIVVWFITGVWHGAAWNFVVWGLMNGIIILISQECTPLYDRFHNRYNVGHKLWFRIFQIARTFWLMSFIRILDCYRDVGTTFRMYGTIFTKNNYKELFNGGLLNLGLSIEDYVVLIVCVAIIFIVSMIQRSGSVRDKLAARPIALRYAIYFALFLGILIFGAYGVGYDSSQFIYSQF